MSDFLKRLSRDPYAPIDGASVTRVDELGNGYDDFGQLIAPAYVQPEQTWGETALGVATAPARLATALAGSLSPYGSEGWQVPPIMSEGADALTAVGDAYSGNMAPEDINSRALGMAGFMMGGGGLAARPTIAAENAGARLSRSAFGRSQLPIDEIYPTLDRLNRAVAEDDLRPRWAAAFPESPTWEEIQPDWWLNNRNMDNAASRQIGGDGDLWIAMNRAGNVTPNAGFSNDLAPMSNASDLPGISALKGAERLATPSGISLDYLDLLNSVGPGKSTLHANASKEASVPAIAGALDMSTEARLARAKELGFDTSKTWYHGTDKEFDKFDLGYAGSGGNAGNAERAAFFTDNPSVADSYLGKQYINAASPNAEKFVGSVDDGVKTVYGEGSRVLPVMVKGSDGLEVWDMGGGPYTPEFMKRALREAREANATGVMFENMRDPGLSSLGRPKASNVMAVFDPRNIRSVNAAFDPAKSDSANLLAANSDSRPALLAGAGQEQEDGYADGGRVGLPSPYSVAKSMIGQREGRGNDLLNRFLNGDTAGMTSAEYAWCSRFVKQAAAKAGVDVAKATDMARSWLDVGQHVDKPAVGDVVVLSRGNPNSQYGHVGFYEGTNPDGTIKILSGNHNNAVASGSYPASRVLGYRRLDGQPEAYDPATGQQGLKPLAMMDGVGREVPALPAPTPEPSQVADEPKPSFDLTKLASVFAEPEPAQAPQVNFTPIQAFQSQGSPIQASAPYRGTFADGGQVRGLPDQSEPLHAGPLHSTVPGRTDHLPITVAAGSFVLPADIVSSLGEGNTNAGMEAVSKMFPLPPARRADGGRVPIAAAGGEYVIAPETVTAIGDGDMQTGHDLLDQFVRRARAQNIQRLRALPGPEK